LFAHTLRGGGLLPFMSDNTGQDVWNGFGQVDLW
jgi:hypothetical protein